LFTQLTRCECASDVEDAGEDAAAPRRCYSLDFAIVQPVKTEYGHATLMNIVCIMVVALVADFLRLDQHTGYE